MTVLQHNIAAALGALRQARSTGNADSARIYERRLNYLLNKIPKASSPTQ